MKITCTRNVMASGKALEAGQTYDVSDQDGVLLIGMGKAVKAAEECSIKSCTPKRRKASKDVEQ